MYYKTLSEILGQHAITEHITNFTAGNRNSVKNNTIYIASCYFRSGFAGKVLLKT